MARWFARRSLRFKIIALVVVLTMITLGGAAVMTATQVKLLILAEKQQDVSSYARILATACRRSLAAGNIGELRSIVKRSVGHSSIDFAAVYDRQGRLVACAPEGSAIPTSYFDRERIPGTEDALVAECSVLGPSPRTPPTPEGAFSPRNRQEAIQPAVAGNRATPWGQVVVGVSNGLARRAQRGQLHSVLASALAVALLSGVVLMKMASRWTRRLEELVGASERISRGDYSCRIQAGGEDEIGRLGSAFQSMLCAVHQRDRELRELNATLQQAGHEVENAENGRDGLEILRRGGIRMVIADWEMPGMDGPDPCRAIRGEHFDGYVHTILLTCHDSPEATIEGLSAGADDFITKPFHPGELAVRVGAGERIPALETPDVPIFAMAKLAESRDPHTGAHLERIRNYCRALVERLARRGDKAYRRDASYAGLIYLTSLLHDIGRLGGRGYPPVRAHRGRRRRVRRADLQARVQERHGTGSRQVHRQGRVGRAFRPGDRGRVPGRRRAVHGNPQPIRRSRGGGVRRPDPTQSGREARGRASKGRKA